MPSEQTHARRKVLVVEDGEATPTVEELTLIAAGFDPRMFTDGGAALQAIADEEFELVVRDPALPEVDGWAVLGRLRAEERTARVPVLIVTARDDAETQQKARLAGANGYLTKPFDVPKFRSAARDLIGAAWSFERPVPVTRGPLRPRFARPSPPAGAGGGRAASCGLRVARNEQRLAYAAIIRSGSTTLKQAPPKRSDCR